MQSEHFMREAIAKAREGIELGDAPFAACIVQEGRLLGVENNTVVSGFDITAHAVINLLRKVCQEHRKIDFSKCVVYSTNEPCSMCFSACHWAQTKEIVFGSSIEDTKELGFRDITISNRRMNLYKQSPVVIDPNFLRYENLQLFEEWLSQKHRTVY